MRNWSAAVGLTAMVAASGATLAHEGATGAVAKRMDLMKEMGGAMKTLTPIMRGKEAYDVEKVRAQAAVIRKNGGHNITDLFPEGTDDPPSEALPKIWEDWARFQSLANRLSRTAGALEAAADNPRGGGSDGEESNGGGSDPGMESGGLMQSGGMGADDPPSAEELAEMAPAAVFQQVAETCSTCHKTFRQKKQ